MADVALPSVATATPAAADTVAGVQGGAVKRFAVSNLAKVGSFTQAGAGAVARTVESKLQDAVSVKDFGGVGDGVTDDSAAVLAASAQAVAVGGEVSFGGGVWLIKSALLFTSAHDGLRWNLAGGTIKKGFSGDLASFTDTKNFSILGTGTIDGQHGTYTGKGFIFSGVSDNPSFGPGIKFVAFTDSHIECGINAGKRARILCNFLPGTGQTDFRAVHFVGTDTGAMQRSLIGCNIPSGYVDLDGTQDTIIDSCVFRRVEISSACSITQISNSLWGNYGVAMTIDGVNTVINGCRFSGDVTLSSTMTGVFAGNIQTSGAFTNNSIASTTIVLHRNGESPSLMRIGKHILDLSPSVGYTVPRFFAVSAGDADYNWNLGTGNIIRYASTLTANRTVNLSTASVTNGAIVRVVRTAADSGGPWTVSVGGLKALSANQWCELFYNGSAWQLGAFGSL